MDTQEAVIYRIRQLCKEKGFTSHGIAIFSAVPPATVKSILHRESKSPGIESRSKSYAMASALRWASFLARRNLMGWSRR